MAESAGHIREPAAGGGRFWLLAAAFAYLAFVVYGSLVPLDFAPRPLGDAWARFAAIPYLDLDIRSRTDWAVNILLYAPLAFLWTGVLWPGALWTARRGVAAVLVSLLVWAGAAALSVGIEFTQIFFPSRTTSQDDIMANAIGAALGVLAWWWREPWLWRTVRSWVGEERDGPLAERFLWVYLAVLFGYSLLPLDLTLSPVEVYHKWRAGLVVLVPFGFHFASAIDMFNGLATDALIWLPAGFLWTVSGRMRPARAVLWTLAMATLIEFLQLFVFSRVTDVTDVVMAVVGGAVGAMLARAARPMAAAASGPRGRLGRAGLGLAAFVAWFAVIAAIFWYPWGFDLSPARLAAGLERFWRVPLYYYYYGTEFHAVTEVLHKFLYFVPLGAALAFALGRSPGRRRGPGAARAAALAAAVASLGAALVIELGQAFLPGRIPSSTDAMIELLGAMAGYWAMGLVREHHARAAPRASGPASGPASGSASGPASDPKPTSRRVAKGVPRLITRVALLALGLAVLAGGMRLVVSLPGAPYNLRELFVAAGPVPPTVWFALWLLWTGASAAAIGYAVARVEFAFVTVPLLVVASAVVSYALLAASVTPESIADIIGVPIVSRLPASSAFWEGVRQSLLMRAPSPGAIDRAENLLRYVALYSPLAILLAILSASVERLAINRRVETVRFFLIYGLIYLVLMAPWLYLAKLVIIDFAATDNLTELIAPSRLAVAGWAFLFMLIGLAALNATLLARASMAGPRRFLIALAATPVAAAFGWLLFKAGLVSALTKYGVTFSGVDFLLGPNRETLLPTATLFLRWEAVYVAGVAVLAYGQRIALPIGRTSRG